jgi:hypothetical protein
MISSVPTTLRSATHVAFDVVTPDRLQKLGATSIVRVADCLVIGPCSRDAQEHARLRVAWWGEDGGWDRLYAPEVRWEPPIVVWAACSPRDRINLWRTCSWLRTRGVSHQDVSIVEMPFKPHRNPDADRLRCSHSVSDFSDGELLSRLAAAKPCSRARYEQAADLWDVYTDPDLSRFAQAVARGIPDFPELPQVWAVLAHFFPRRTAEGVLRPSLYDDMLLGMVTTEWRTGVKVYVAGTDDWWHLMSCIGDLTVVDRLNQWATYGATPAIERAPGPDAEVPMKAHVYRITEHGRRLRDRGLAQLADAPPLPVAGTVAYAAPWVLRPDGTLG